MHLPRFIIGALLTLTTLTSSAETALEFDQFEVVGTEIRLTDSDGRVLSEDELIGAKITLGDSNDHQIMLRIDAVEHDADDPELVFYNFSARAPGSEQWQTVCQPDYDGNTMGFLLEASTTPDGGYEKAEGVYSLQCTSGSSGKCVRWGYKPWANGPDGRSLWDHHQACTRMARADYCGDGVPHTKDGTTINMYDPLGIQLSDPSPEFSFEAAWGPEGALCVRKVRWPDISSLEALAESCPRLHDRLGEVCSEAGAAQFGEVLLLNESEAPFIGLQ